MGQEDHFLNINKGEENLHAGHVIDVEALIRKTFEEDAHSGMEMIFRHYYGVLCSHAVRYVSSKALAEDIVSDILFEFQSKGLNSTITTSYRAYLFTSVRNRAYDILKKEMRHGNTVIENAMSVAAQHSEQPDSITQFEELHHLIESTINAMPLKRKQVYLMHRFEGKKSREIADELKLSQRTIEAHIHKAIWQVQAALKQHWLWTFIIFLNI
ncbi:RNA polymerase sigma-70 factor [Cytophagales bacterium WSM2-2]|nr:RNA polymerase sigma-70 factor [Cytophagales bacterium WSM2-2]